MAEILPAIQGAWLYASLILTISFIINLKDIKSFGGLLAGCTLIAFAPIVILAVALTQKNNKA